MTVVASILPFAIMAFFGKIDEAALIKFYATHLRGNLFSGFLTLSAFLLSAQTFIVVHLKKEIYGSDEYHNRIRELKRVKPSLTTYGPLRRLSNMLFATVLMSLVAALLQLTVGLLNEGWAVWVCIGAAVLSLIPLFISLFVMAVAMRSWFTELEKDVTTQSGDSSQEN